MQFCLAYQLNTNQFKPSFWYERRKLLSLYSRESFNGLKDAGGGRGINWRGREREGEGERGEERERRGKRFRELYHITKVCLLLTP